MGLETGEFIADLVDTNPTGSDPKSQGDDHLRLIKKVLQNTFPDQDAIGQLPEAGAAEGQTLRWNNSTMGWETTGDLTVNSNVAQSGFFEAVSANPWFLWNETDQALDSKVWRVIAQSSQLSFAVLDDAKSAAFNFLSVVRSANSINNIVYGNATDLPPHQFRGEVRADEGLSTNGGVSQQIDSSGNITAGTAFFSTGAGSELTIVAGVVTATQGYHKIDTEGDAASDDLVTINGGIDGRQLRLVAADNARTVVVKGGGSGNIFLEGAADFSIDHNLDYVDLHFDGVSNVWVGRGVNIA